MCGAASSRSFNHLVVAGEQRRWHFEADRLGRDQVDDEIELDRLLDRTVAWLCPAQNLVDVVTGAPEQVRDVRSVGHEPSGLNILPSRRNRWKMGACRQDIDPGAVADQQRIGTNKKEFGAVCETVEGGRDILGAPDFQRADRKAERAGCRLNLIHLQSVGRIPDISQNRQPAEARDYLAQKLEAL